MSWVIDYYRSSIGKKLIMAVTGIILSLFVLGHMVGNTQVYMGADKLNAYGHLLQSLKGPLWLIRAFLFTCVAVHLIAAIQLFILNWKSRPVGYKMMANLGVDYAARTMVWSGPIIAFFVFYHILHFTTGTVHPDFIPGDVYHNFVVGFSNPWAALAYIVANTMLAFHLYHGLWSWTQTLGWDHPKYNFARRGLSILLAIVIGVVNVSFPVAVLTGVVHL